MVLDDLIKVLVDAEVGTEAPSGAIWKAFLPSTPDTVITLYPTGGSAGEAVLDGWGPKYEHHGVQVVSRSATLATAETNIQNCYDTLRVLVNAPINGSFYLSVTPVQPPFLLMKDENERWVYAFNVDAMRAI
jgi:hypothetical protein